MKSRFLFWQFFGAHVLILLGALGFLSLYAWKFSAGAFREQWVRELEMQARLAAALLPEGGDLARLDRREVAGFFRRLGDEEAHRFSLILPDGTVIGDTRADIARLESHRDRPEIVAAFREGRGVSERYSVSLGRHMLYVALRIPPRGDLQGVIRVSVPSREWRRDLQEARRSFLWVCGLVLVAALGLSLPAARRIIGPVAALTEGLNRVGSGDLSFRLALPSVPHLRQVARAINRSSEQLQRSFHALREERNRRAMVLASMTHGVLAVGNDHRVLEINEAARKMLSLAETDLTGAPLSEVVRRPDLFALIEWSEESAEMVERESADAGADGRVLRLRASPLRSVEGKRIGTLVVLNDVTRIRRLERMRSDFVANVSHELRTPVTAIKGFAEALLEETNPPDAATAKRFLNIIARQARGMEALIDDLLTLARLENSAGETIAREPVSVRNVLREAVEICRAKNVSEAEPEIRWECPEDLTAHLHAGLLEQAVVNLLDNAVKYGARDGRVRVDLAARREGEAGVAVTVRDYGPGIDPRHADRIFERFYRIDKGRSRELGGTGLGLAIVKHIAQALGGSVELDSRSGEGATFILRFPGRKPGASK